MDTETMLRPMLSADLSTVLAIEQQAYPVPWTYGNFVDSIAAGHPAYVLVSVHSPHAILGYTVAMRGVHEWHLLNVVVASMHRRQGYAQHMLTHIIDLCQQERVHQLWLEVRQSNASAQALYAGCGFVFAGQRRGYYPLPHSHCEREDAVVMVLRWPQWLEDCHADQ
jgi:[ribosomal protein S18]-alanine N-acetyltransferase